MKKVSLVLFLFSFLFLASDVLAAGSATVQWVAPTTNEGDGTPLMDLAGYRVCRDTSSRWSPCAEGAATSGVGTCFDVAGGNVLKHLFMNSLTPGVRNYFTVFAYDNNVVPSRNFSSCAKTNPIDGEAQSEVSMVITYSGDVVRNGDVNMADFTALRSAWGSANQVNYDLNGDGAVGMPDYTIMRVDWNSPVLTL